MARTFLFKFLKTFIIDINLNLNFETVSNHREVNNSNRGDVASLAWDYCSLIIRALHFELLIFLSVDLKLKSLGEG